MFIIFGWLGWFKIFNWGYMHAWHPVIPPEVKDVLGIFWRSKIPCQVFRCLGMDYSWWLNQPVWKMRGQKWIISPKTRGEHEECLKPPPSFQLCQVYATRTVSFSDFRKSSWTLPKIEMFCRLHLTCTWCADIFFAVWSRFFQAY